MLIDLEDESSKEKISILEYLDQSSSNLDDSLSLLHPYIYIRKVESVTFGTLKGYESELENLFIYRSDDYPKWFRGYCVLHFLCMLYSSKIMTALHNVRIRPISCWRRINTLQKKGQFYHNVGNELFIRGNGTASVYLEKALDLKLEHDLDFLRMKTLTYAIKCSVIQIVLI